MSNLLHLVRFPLPKKAQKTGTLPLIMEFPVPSETSPYLVTSSDSVLWVSESMTPVLADASQSDIRGPFVRAAVRRGATKQQVFREIFDAVSRLGAEADWGNVQPFTAGGLQAAAEHLQSYGFSDLEVLVPRTRLEDESLEGPEDDDEDEGYRRPEWLEKHGIKVCPTSWLPRDTAILVPKDREFVGFIGILGSALVAVVHNASRGMAILR